MLECLILTVYKYGCFVTLLPSRLLEVGISQLLEGVCSEDSNGIRLFINKKEFFPPLSSRGSDGSAEACVGRYEEVWMFSSRWAKGQ